MKRVGFVGLGVMGGPMAGHVLRSGAPLTVWNRTAEKAWPFAEAGATVAADLSELASGCDLILLCVNRTEDVRECLSAMLPAAAPGTLFVDHSTISPAGAQELHLEVAASGKRFVDAPITGGSTGAQKGALTVFCGGEEADVEDARATLAAYSKKIERVGGPGAGQMAKMSNQIAVGGALLGLCESMSFARKAGLDLTQIHSLIAGGAGGSWAFENYGPKILQGDWSPGFSVKNQRKDFDYCRDAARRLGASIPGTDLVDRLLSKLEAAGHGELATAVLYELMLEELPT